MGVYIVGLAEKTTVRPSERAALIRLLDYSWQLDRESVTTYQSPTSSSVEKNGWYSLRPVGTRAVSDCDLNPCSSEPVSSDWREQGVQWFARCVARVIHVYIVCVLSCTRVLRVGIEPDIVYDIAGL